MVMRALLVSCLAVALLASVPGAAAHRSGSDGGPAERGCGVLRGVSPFGPVGVGATRVKCRTARRVARASVKGQRLERWRCTGRRTRFGHCHRRGASRRIVHWYAAH